MVTNRWRLSRCLLASASILTCTFGTALAAGARAEGPRVVVTNDADLAPRLAHIDVARGRFYRHVIRRDWAGAAAAAIKASRVVSERRVVAAARRSAVVTSVAPTGTWRLLADCESSGDWGNVNPPYYGGIQFTISSWRAVGGTGLPSDASPAEQIARGQALLRLQGPGAWPICSYRAGLR